MSTNSVAQSREIKNGGDSKLVVSAGTWRKKGYVDIRNYWRSPDGEWHPTKRGVRVGEDDARNIAAAISTLLPASRNGHTKPTPTTIKRPYKPPVRHEPATTFRPRYLTPGKDHRRTHGKATFKRNGTCKTTAYWGNSIHAPISAEEWAVCSAITQAVQHVGGYPQSKQVIRPSVLVPPSVYRPNSLTKLAA
jgi:hypothetical protein